MNQEARTSTPPAPPAVTAADVERIRAVYHVGGAANEIEAAAHGIALEQTVEVPAALAESEPAAKRLVGEVAAIEPVDASDASPCYAVTIDYRAELAAAQLPQLLNLVYGNISIKRHIRLVDLALPDAWLARFRGPGFGIEGLRALTGVYGRPLLATALKPRGASNDKLAQMAEAFARGGGDIVKDDHNLVDESLDAFVQRIDACQCAVERANAATGRQCLYAPNVCARADEIERYFAAVAQRGIAGVLVSPMVIGLDQMRVVSARFGLAVLAHPTFAGTFFHDRMHGIEPGVLLGTIFRLAGADVSIFPNFGGRFTFTRDDCTRIADRLRAPLGELAPAYPAPAGGMKFENIPDMAAQYGADAVFLVGGALLGDDRPLEQATTALLDAIREPFDERLVAPQPIIASACEMPAAGGVAQGRDAAARGEIAHLPFNADFSWQGRPASEYKASEKQAQLPFKDVARHELIGQHGEDTAFDLRYFEIAPGGYTSCEKHEHTHAIITTRGRGILQTGDDRRELRPFDIAYVPPMQTHQFLNASSDEPFGFFCIVDHERDRPMQP